MARYKVLIYAFCSTFYLLAGCALLSSSEYQQVPENEYEFLIKTDKDNRRFELVLRSLSNQPICLDYEDWPNANGEMHFASDWVYIMVNNKKYPLAVSNFGSCVRNKPNACLLPIASGQELRGHLNFYNFGINTSELENIKEPLRLNFDLELTLWYCK